MKKKRLGEVLRERGHVSAADLNSALQEQQTQARLVHLGELMLQRGVVSKKDLTSALMEVSQVPYFDCTVAQIDPDILKLVPAAMARRCRALPVAVDSLRAARSRQTAGELMTVSAADPLNLAGIILPGARVSPLASQTVELLRASSAPVEMAL